MTLETQSVRKLSGTQAQMVTKMQFSLYLGLNVTNPKPISTSPNENY